MIIADILKTGAFDDQMVALVDRGLDDAAIAWEMTDHLVRSAQKVFRPAWDRTRGDDGYVSFELDPLLEDKDSPLPQAVRTRRYVELGQQWSAGHVNRMIKVPATPAGIDALADLAAAGGDDQRDAVLHAASVSGLARRHLARGAATAKPRRFQERVQHLHLAGGCIYPEARAATQPADAGVGGDRQCQADVEGERGVLEGQGAEVASGDHLRIDGG